MRLETDRHIDETTMEGYVIGSLSSEATAEVEKHLLICEACRQRVSESEDYVRAMASAAEHLPAARGRWQWDFRVLLPAAACAALMVFMVLRLSPGGAKTSAVAVALSAIRGNDAAAHAPSGRPLRLQPDLNGLAPSGSYRLELVTASGSSAWQGTLYPPAALLPAQAAGTYFVRVSLPGGTLLREYALEVKP